MSFRSNIALQQQQETTLQSILTELKSLNQNIGSIGGGTGGGTTGTIGENFLYQRTYQQAFAMTPSQTKVVLDSAEKGRLMAIVFKAENKNVGLFAELTNNTANSPLFVVDTDFETLLKIGAGIAPGDAALLPGPISPDPTGIPLDGYPWLMRWKDTTEADVTGSTGTTYVMAYTPSVYTPYDLKIKVSLKNFTSVNQTVNSIDIRRLVSTV